MGHPESGEGTEFRILWKGQSLIPLAKKICDRGYDDFLLLRQLQGMGLPMLSGSHLMRGGYRRRVAVELALNAQGLDGEFSQMDALAMGLVAAARVRLAQLGPVLAGGEIRFAIFGLTMHSTSNEYLERQVIQEGLRNGLSLQRNSNLPEEACAHLARLLE